MRFILHGNKDKFSFHICNVRSLDPFFSMLLLVFLHMNSGKNTFLLLESRSGKSTAVAQWTLHYHIGKSFDSRISCQRKAIVGSLASVGDLFSHCKHLDVKLEGLLPHELDFAFSLRESLRNFPLMILRICLKFSTLMLYDLKPHNKYIGQSSSTSFSTIS